MMALKTLDLRCNDIKRLPDELALLATSLRTLRVRSNELIDVPHCIVALTNLEELQLANNLIVVLDPGLGNLQKLTSLYLYHNAIKELPDEFSKLEALKELDLSWNQLLRLPASLSSMSSLSNMLATNNKIREVQPKFFIGLVSLQELNISHNFLKTLPEQASQLVELRKLIINDNKLVSFPDLSTISDLRWLELGNNKLRQFLPSLCNLKNVIVLNLFANGVETVPPEIGQLTCLQKLYLSYNKIKKLPDNLSDLRQLSTLFLGGNKFDDIPEIVFKLGGLKELCMSNNNVSLIPDDFSKLQGLESARFTCNKIKRFPPSISTVFTLIELDVSHNEIESLPDDIGKLTAITDLDLSGNELTDFPESFMTLAEILHLKIGFNKLRKLPKFPHATKRTWISCTGNEALNMYYSQSINHLDGKSEDKFIEKVNKMEEKRLKHEKKKNNKTKKTREKGDDSDTDTEEVRTNRKPSTGAQNAQITKVTTETNISRENGTQNKDPEVKSTKPNEDTNDNGSQKYKKPKINEVPPVPVEQPFSYREKFGWAEMRGRRPDMQDTLTIISDYRSKGQHLLCMFDGHAGSTSSEFAAKSLPGKLWTNLSKIENTRSSGHNEFKMTMRKDGTNPGKAEPPANPTSKLSDKDLDELMRHTFADVHNDIMKQKLEDGTAALVCLVLEDRLVIANSGDQRAVLCKGGKPDQLTEDHKPDAPKEKK